MQSRHALVPGGASCADAGRQASYSAGRRRHRDCCSPTGRYVAIAAENNHLAIWDTAQAKSLVDFPPHGVIRSIAWSADERILVTGRGVVWPVNQNSPGPSLFVWDAASATELLRFGSDSVGVRGIALSPDGSFLLASGMLGQTAAQGSTLDLWEIASGRLWRRLARIEPDGAASAPFFQGVAFSPDGALALSACGMSVMPPNMRRAGKRELPAWWNRGIRAWTVSTGQEADTIPQSASVKTISISNDGTRLFFAGGRFGVWDLANGRLLWDKQNSYATAAASPDCGVVARGRGYRVDKHGPYDDTGLELFDGLTGELISAGLHQTPVEAISMTSGGTSVIAGGEQGELRFWHYRSPRLCENPFPV